MIDPAALPIPPAFKFNWKLDLVATAQIGKVITAIQWLELFMMQFIRNNDWNTSVAMRWLIDNPHPMFYQWTMSPEGMVQIICNKNLVNPKLRIGKAPVQPQAGSAGESTGQTV